MEANGITFGYGKTDRQLMEVTAQIEPGRITTIIGPNGCGKSTLLGILSGHLFPQGGQAILDGKAIHEYKPKELAMKLAVVHQQNDAPTDMTVERLTGLGRQPHRRWFGGQTEEDEEAMSWALSCTQLLDKRHEPLDRLSGGERQRAWIAMALAQRTPMLFLDEPTTYLDIYHQLEVLALVRRLNREHGLTILMVLHDINQAVRYSDRIIVMKQGRIFRQGEPQAVVTASMVREVYDVHAIVKHDEETGMYLIPMDVAEETQ